MKTKKKPPKTIDDLEKSFKEFEKTNKVKEVRKEDFEKVLKKVIPKKK